MVSIPVPASITLRPGLAGSLSPKITTGPGATADPERLPGEVTSTSPVSTVPVEGSNLFTASRVPSVEP